MAKKYIKKIYKNTKDTGINSAEKLSGLTHKDILPHCSPFGFAESDSATENIANDLGLTAADMEDFKG